MREWGWLGGGGGGVMGEGWSNQTVERLRIKENLI